MGDILEITTRPRHHHVFYKFTANAINFEIKAVGNAALGISNKPEQNCEFLIGIGHNNRTWIKKVRGRGVYRETIDTPNLLSATEYRRFWVSWYGDIIRLGVNGNSKPIVTFSSRTAELKYVTFLALDDVRNTVHWRIEVPPYIEKSYVMRPISGGDPYWVPYDRTTDFPDNAYIGGHENENLYIIRADHNGSLTPGKYMTSKGMGYIPWGGEANSKLTFEVLCGFNFTWIPCKNTDAIPVGAVVGGYSEDPGKEKLYIGRSKYLEHLIPGKIQPSHKVCYVPYEGREIGLDKFEILVVPDDGKRCVSKFLIPGALIDHRIVFREEEQMNMDIEHAVNFEEYAGFLNPDVDG